jgi:hypothetical protein
MINKQNNFTLYGYSYINWVGSLDSQWFTFLYCFNIVNVLATMLTKIIVPLHYPPLNEYIALSCASTETIWLYYYIVPPLTW